MFENISSSGENELSIKEKVELEVTLLQKDLERKQNNRIVGVLTDSASCNLGAKKNLHRSGRILYL